MMIDQADLRDISKWRPEEVTVYGARIRAAIMNNRLRAHHDQ